MSAAHPPAGDTGSGDWHRFLDWLTGELATLRRDVDELTATIDHLANQPAGPGPSRWSWRHATDEQRRGLWAELRDFVDQLNARYQLPATLRIPPCWYAHPIAVEELTALMAAWQAAYRGRSQPSADLIAWHDHWLWPCLNRLRDLAGWKRCTDTHQPADPNAVRTDHRFEEFIATDPAAGLAR